MAKAIRNHTAAFAVAPQTDKTVKSVDVEVVETPGKKHGALSLLAVPHGGFMVMPDRRRDEYGLHMPLASFSTLDEALAWLRVNMAQPALEAQAAR